MTKRENILIKVQRMLLLAEGATNEHEAAAAAAMAHKFMLQHDLCIEDLGEITEEDTEIFEEEIYETGRMANWRLNLFCGVARAFGCSPLVQSGRRSRALRLVGTKANMGVARSTFEYLVEAVERMAKRKVKGEGRSVISSYKLGVTSTVVSRLRKQAKENAEEVNKTATKAGTELVLVKDAALKEHMAQYTGTYKRPQSAVNNYGYSRGKHDGHGVSLNAQVGGKSTNRLH
jgi:hypothetical protein